MLITDPRNLTCLGGAMKPVSRIRVIGVIMASSGPPPAHSCKRDRQVELQTTVRNHGQVMITEIAQIDVKSGMEAEFENGVKQAVPIFKRAKGCRNMELRRSIEKPARYRLFVGWDTVENHTVDFRGSADFQEWRKLVGHCFASPPEVEHMTQTVRGF
jgi:quinol monooxygenase YgiN